MKIFNKLKEIQLNINRIIEINQKMDSVVRQDIDSRKLSLLFAINRYKLQNLARE